MTALRPYQVSALEGARAHVAAGSQSVLIQLATGLGKTRIAVEACVGHIAKGGLPLFVAPRRELVAQATAALEATGATGWTVRTIQELSVEGAEIPPATMVVLDEARHYLSDSWSLLRSRLPNAVYLGLDATPERGDGRGLGAMFDAIVSPISIAEAVMGGWLVPADILRPDRALGPGELAMDPVDAVLAHARGSTIVFCPSVQSAVEYTCRFRAADIPAAAVWGDMVTKDRDRILLDYAEGRTRVLCNMNLLTEGWDAPRTETIVLARGFGTSGTYLQAVGRGLRPWEGKASCLVLDLRGVSHLHGDPDEPRTYHLEGKAIRRAGDDPDIRFCAVCGSVLKKDDVACPECGREGTHRMRPPRVLGLPIDRFARKREEDDGAKARTLGRWLSFARSKGHREGAAMHRYKATYGEWPSPAVVAQARRMR